MLTALLAGEVDPTVLAELARGRMRSKRDLLAQALQGQLKSHHRFLIASNSPILTRLMKPSNG